MFHESLLLLYVFHSSSFNFSGNRSLPRSGGAVDAALLAQWESQLDREPSVALIGKVAEAFEAALKSIVQDDGGDEKGKGKKPRKGAGFKVKGGAIFNAVVRLCLTKMEPALRRVLKVSGGKGMKNEAFVGWIREKIDCISQTECAYVVDSYVENLNLKFKFPI